jgi:protein-tyrosine phosphatase
VNGYAQIEPEPGMGGFSYLMEGTQLAQGSAPPPGVRLPFDTIVLAAREYQPHLPGYHVMHVPLDDGPPPSAATLARIRVAAHEVARRVRIGHRVLVTCWQGRNRSGVIAGLALRELGVPGNRAANRIRRLRDGLTNPHFYAIVAGAD